MNDVLVTGGCGFIGSHLVDRLILDGCRVTVIDDLSNGSLSNIKSQLPKILVYDVGRKGIIDLDGKVDVIFHLACHPRSNSLKNPWRDIDTNLVGTVNILEFARKCDAKIIFSSNSGIYDYRGIMDKPLDESCLDNPTTPYDIDKLAAEHYIKAYGNLYGMPYVIFRFATVYGLRQKVNEALGWSPVVVKFIQQVQRGETVVVDGDGTQTRDFIYVGDVVDGLVKAANPCVNGGPLLLGTSCETCINELLTVVCRVVGKKAKHVHGPLKAGDIKRMWYSNEKAKRVLRWLPKYSLEDGVKEIVKT